MIVAPANPRKFICLKKIYKQFDSIFNTMNQEIVPNILVENVQKWLVYENQLKIIHEKTKLIRDQKHQLTQSICQHMNQKSTKQLHLSDGVLTVYEKKEYSPLTFTYIEESLGKIIPDKTHVAYIIDHLKKNREVKTSHELRKTGKK
ncbi:MAG: hypothetical protein RL642_1268 [Bacteroidota bacterium]|jgi:hypothetical protein